MVTSSRKLFCVTGCPDCDCTWKNAGISAAIVHDILGHESVAISQNYGRTDGSQTNGDLGNSGFASLI